MGGEIEMSDERACGGMHVGIPSSSLHVACCSLLELNSGLSTRPFLRMGE